MVLNYIWVGFFLIGITVSLIKLIFFQDMTVFPALLQSTFDTAKKGFEISIGLTGVMTLWLGLMKIGERGGMVAILAKLVGPFFSRLFPEVPRDHPATGTIIMKFSTNMLGLDNASTPIGLKAMKELQDLNPDKETASNAQIMFLVLNTSGMTIIPIAILADRTILGSTNPTSIFIPTLIATFFSTLIGLIYVSYKQKINLLDPVIAAYILGTTAFIGASVWYFSTLSPEALQQQSTLITSIIIILLIASFMLLGLKKRLPLFETFIEGAKEGFETAIKIIPFLVAMFVAIGIFRESGTLTYISQGIGWVVGLTGLNTDFVEALPVALMKPMSSGASRALMLEIAQTSGVDSFVGNLTSILRGCADTTFYILALYFGSVNIRKTRYAVTGGLIADFAGIIAAIFVGYLFFH